MHRLTKIANRRMNNTTGYVLLVPAEYVESFEALLDFACEAAEITGMAEMWSDNEREAVKAIKERKWVAEHND